MSALLPTDAHYMLNSQLLVAAGFVLFNYVFKAVGNFQRKCNIVACVGIQIYMCLPITCNQDLVKIFLILSMNHFHLIKKGVANARSLACWTKSLEESWFYGKKTPMISWNGSKTWEHLGAVGSIWEQSGAMGAVGAGSNFGSKNSKMIWWAKEAGEYTQGVLMALFRSRTHTQL